MKRRSRPGEKILAPTKITPWGRGRSALSSVGWREGLAMLLTRQPSLPCGPPPRHHIRRVRSRFSRITARHLPGREPGLSPALHRAVLADDLAEFHARFAKR